MQVKELLKIGYGEIKNKGQRNKDVRSERQLGILSKDASKATYIEHSTGKSSQGQAQWRCKELGSCIQSRQPSAA
jgi:hypothetical protein